MVSGNPNQKRKRTSRCNSSNAKESDSSKDYISLLPDAVLLTIISLLPTREAGRTTILSKRWQLLWESAPLSLVDSELCGSMGSCRFLDMFMCTHNRTRAVTKILESHQGPVQRFCLVHGDFNFADACVDNWLHTVTKKGVKQLELNISSNIYPVPVQILQCKSIELLTLQNARFPDLSAVSPRIKGLLELTLSRVIIADVDLKKMVLGLDALRSLSISTILPNTGDSAATRCFHLCSRSLRSFTIVSGTVTELLIDAPALERCLIGPQRESGMSVQIISAPKLKMVGYLEIDLYLSKLGSNLKKGIQQSFGSAVHAMRTLGVAVGLDAYIQSSSTLRLLQCFCFVETLHIQLLPTKAPPFLSSGFRETVECLDHHLKQVIFHQYKDRKGESEFARYLLSNGKVLKEMKFLVPKGRRNKWAEMENKLLRSMTTAPYCKRITWQELEVGGAYYFPINASNWSLVDPFDG